MNRTYTANTRVSDLDIDVSLSEWLRLEVFPFHVAFCSVRAVGDPSLEGVIVGHLGC